MRKCKDLEVSNPVFLELKLVSGLLCVKKGRLMPKCKSGCRSFNRGGKVGSGLAAVHIYHVGLLRGPATACLPVSARYLTLS